MNISLHICRLLSILLIAGLALAPLSAPVNAGKGMHAGMEMPAHAAIDVAAADMTAEMAADTPCCPDKTVPMDCDQCPLMALCMVSTFPVPVAAGVLEIRPVTLRLLAPPSDPQGDGLGQHPPPKPPRSLSHSA